MSRYKLTRNQYNVDQAAQAQARKEEYEANPNKCLFCCSSLPYKSKKKFCNNSCSAKYSNANRSQLKEKILSVCSVCNAEFEQPARKKETCSRSCAAKSNANSNPKTPSKKKSNKIRIGDVRGDAIFTRVYQCRCCQKYVDYKIIKYCSTCQPNVRMYRARCEFKFNVYDYPDKFDVMLIETHGWYSPGGKKGHKTKNTNGVARDHLYTVADGFKNGIDPELLAHPANCQLLLQLENVKKRDTSSITFEELLQRIADW